MFHVNTNIFNPEIIYVVDFWNEKKNLRGFHQHDFIEISVILEGTVNYEFFGKQMRLNAGDVLLFNPSISHTESHPQGYRSRELHIGLSNIFIEGLPYNTFPNKDPLLNLAKDKDTFFEKAWELTNVFRNHQVYHELKGKGIILEMLSMILKNLTSHHSELIEPLYSENDKKNQTLVNHTIYYLENHHVEDITLEKLAEMLYISSAQLSKVFKNITGKSPIQYLIEIRLKHAYELLNHTNLTIKEISEKVGYNDPFYFSKLFKKHYDHAPSTLRKKLKSQK